jgi:hypothetical protein
MEISGNRTIVSNNSSFISQKSKKRDFQLSPLKIILIFLFEIIIELYYGTSFWINSSASLYTPELLPICDNLRKWCLSVAILYITEIGVAFVCLLIGLTYFIAKRKAIIRLYIGLTNLTKSIIMILNLIFLGFVIYSFYAKSAHCGKLDEVAQSWIYLHYIVISVSVVSIIFIIVISVYIRRNDNKTPELSCEYGEFEKEE